MGRPREYKWAGGYVSVKRWKREETKWEEKESVYEQKFGQGISESCWTRAPIKVGCAPLMEESESKFDEMFSYKVRFPEAI